MSRPLSRGRRGLGARARYIIGTWPLSVSPINNRSRVDSKVAQGMAREKRKGQRSSDDQLEHRGGSDERREKEKRRRSLAQESRGGEERGRPKIRKVTQEETGGKLQIKERDKPTKMRRLAEEEKGKKLAPGNGVEASESARKTTERERKIAFLKGVLEPSYGGEDIPDYLWPFFDGGAAELKRINDNIRVSVKEFKEFAAAIVKMEFNIQV